MDVSEDEILRSVRKWFRIATSGEELPIILMPFDPEGRDDYDSRCAGMMSTETPAG